MLITLVIEQAERPVERKITIFLLFYDYKTLQTGNCRAIVSGCITALIKSLEKYLSQHKNLFNISSPSIEPRICNTYFYTLYLMKL